MVNWLLGLLLCAVRGAAGGWGADSALFSDVLLRLKAP